MTGSAVAISPSLQTQTSTLVEAYERLGSIWLVAEELGMVGQTVHRRLKAAGVSTSTRFTEAERDAISAYYANTPSDQFSLREIAEAIGRPRTSVSRMAQSMGLSDLSRRKSSAAIAKQAAPRWADKPHPRGMAGKSHSEETKKLVGNASKLMWATAKTFGTGICSPEASQRRSDAASKRVQAQPASTA